MAGSEQTNRYNPNSGSQNDIIDQMIAAGASDEEIMAALSQQQGAGAEDTLGGGSELDFLTEQLAGQQEQQEFENILALLDLVDQQEATPAPPELQLPQGAQNDIPTGGGSNPYDAAQNRFAMLQGLNIDKILRGRNKEDALWMMQNQPQQAMAERRPLMDRIAEAQSLMDLLRGKAAGTEGAGAAAPAAAIPTSTPGAGFSGAGGFSTAGDEFSTQGTQNYLEELRKKAMQNQGSGGGFNVGSLVPGFLR